MGSVDNGGTPGVPDVVLATQYDPAGNRSSLAATIGGTKDFLNSYSYDTLSRLMTMQQVNQNGGNVVASKEVAYAYNAIGDVTARSAYNFVGVGPRYDIATSAISYNTLGQLTGISMTSDVGQVALDNLTYSYDTLGRVSTFGSIDGAATYGYDKTSQLTSASYVAASGHVEPPNFSVTFDPNGTRTSANGVSTTAGKDNHLASDGTFTFAYDPAGNLTTRTRISSAAANDYKTVYLWDYRNRLTDVEFYNNSGTLMQHVHYVYDVWNNLIERDLDPNGSGTYTQIVHYVWDSPESQGQGGIVLAFNGADQLIARYLNGPNTSAYDQYYSTLVEEDVTSTSQGGTLTFPQLDQQGSVIDIADNNGNLADHIVYFSTGGVFSESHPSVPHIAGFQGGYIDVVTGMEKFGARWEYMADAFWASQDPMGLSGGLNLTSVDADDPTNLCDPSGLWPGGNPPRYIRPPIHRRGTGPRPAPNQGGPPPGRGPIEGPVRIVPWYHNPIACSDAVDEIENDVLNRMAWKEAERRMREARRAARQTQETLQRKSQQQAEFDAQVRGGGAPVTNAKAGQILRARGRRPFPAGSNDNTVGLTDEYADSYVASCSGQITLRLVRRGESFVRYTDYSSGRGSYVTKTVYDSPEEAADALNLLPWGNSAQYRQRVVANRDSHVLESCVRGGTGRQTIILDPDSFDFGNGVNTATGLGDGVSGPPRPPAPPRQLP